MVNSLHFENCQSGIFGHMKKQIMIMVLVTFSWNIFSQSMDIGGSIGTISNSIYQPDLFSILTFSANLEFRPSHALFSLQTSPTLVTERDFSGSLGRFPLYVKFIIGKQFRICPYFAAYIQTDSNYGYMAGLNLEWNFLKNVSCFVRGDYGLYCYKLEMPSRFGGYNTVRFSDPSITMSFGIMRNIRFKSALME